MKTVLKIALGVVLGLTVMIVGCVALIGAGAEEASKDLEQAARDLTTSTSAQTRSSSEAENPAPARKAANFAKGEAEGDFAIASADGSIDDPTNLRVKVTATPPQKASVTYTVTCTKGTGVGSEDDQFEATTPIKRTLKLPQADPDDCIVAANAQLDEGGKVNIALAG